MERDRDDQRKSGSSGLLKGILIGASIGAAIGAAILGYQVK